MALKYELEQWNEAVISFDEQDYDKALALFETIADSAKIHFNIGMIYATLGEHQTACQSYTQAIQLDQYFSVSYFQKGVSNFLLGDYTEALANFNDALLYLRGNMLIDYEQLGLKFRLYSCEILFNRGLCYLYLGQQEQGMGDFVYAQKEKQTEEHNVIDEAIQDGGQGYTVFSIPVGVLYRPPESKLKNAKAKDYLGKATLIAAADPKDMFTGFAGAETLKVEQAKIDTPTMNSGSSGGEKSVTIAPSAGISGPVGSGRPQSFSSNPKSAPFPVRGKTPPAQLSPRERETVQPLNLNGIGKGASKSTRLARSPTVDSIRSRSPAPEGVQRSKSQGQRGGGSRSNTPPHSMQRANTQSRTQFLQKQLQGNGGKPIPRGYNEEYDDGYYEEGAYYDDAYDGYDDDYYEEQQYYQGGGGGRTRGANLRATPSRGRGPRTRGSMRRPPMRKNTMPRSDPAKLDPYNAEGQERNYASMLWDEEEEYYSGEEDVQFQMMSPPRGGGGRKSMPSKIKVKCHHKDTRVVMVPSSIIYDDLMQRIQEKFGETYRLNVKYKDEDGEEVMMTDQEDLEMAFSLVNIVGSIGRLELWCVGT